MIKIKKILSYIIVGLLLFNNISTASIVSDNDGSAFVTKYEFENLKSNFKNQIDNYNISIDDKIDGAIASYLAGLGLEKEEVLENASSILKYPLYIYNEEWDLTHNNWDLQTGTTKWWSPSLKFAGIYTSAGGQYASGQNNRQITEMYKFEYDRVRNNKNVIKDFYNVSSYDGPNGTCIIDGILKDYNIENDYNALLWVKEGWNAVDAKYGIGVRLDQSDGQYTGGVQSVTITKQRADGTDLFDTNNVPDIPLVCYYDSKSWSWTYTASTYFNTWSSTGYIYYYIYGGNPSVTTLKSWTKKALVADWNKENSLYRLYNTSKTTSLMPVAYNNKVYYTNYKYFKQDMSEDSSAIQSAHAYLNNSLISTSKKNPKIISVIDAGWCLEPDGKSINPSHNWYEHSLINPSRVRYEVVTPVKSDTVYQSLTNGILISDVPNKEVSCGKITINIQQQNETNKRYIVVSKKPIEQYNIESLDDTDLLNIYKDKDCKEGTGVKLYELSIGTNVIYFNNIEPKDNIYYKLLWKTDDTSWTRIVEEPIFAIYS